MKLEGYLLGYNQTKGPATGRAQIEITGDEILAQISEKERFNLATKLMIRPTKQIHD
jgi:hypothetical protein